MPFTLTFHSIEEKVPPHGTEIMFFDTKVNSYGFQSGDLKEGKVFYTWDNDNGTSWVYEGEEEFIYEDGTKPTEEENIRLFFCIESEGAAFGYGPISDICSYYAKRIYWVDAEEFWNILPTDGGCNE
jgi:hypothetical protein